MYKDSLGNTYSRLPAQKPVPGAKPSKGGRKKYGRNRKNSGGPVNPREHWISKVKRRERIAADRGSKFTRYGC